MATARVKVEPKGGEMTKKYFIECLPCKSQSTTLSGLERQNGLCIFHARVDIQVLMTTGLQASLPLLNTNYHKW